MKFMQFMAENKTPWHEVFNHEGHEEHKFFYKIMF